MDVFCDAREVTRRYERYVTDLRRLFLFHGVTCGAAENFGELAVKLEESRALRLDLPAMLRNIRDLEQQGITADEMLTAVALACGGEDLVDGRAGCPGLMRTVSLLQMMLAGVGTWAEASGADRAVPVRDEAGAGGEERVFFELAIQELRVQLAEVKQRMRELEPVMPGVAEPPNAVTAAETVAPRIFAVRDEELAAEAERLDVERAEAERAEAERVAIERERAGQLEAERSQAERVAAERAEVERVRVERVEAERVEAERVAAVERAEAAERERVRAWPLEERVSPLPAIPKRPRVAAVERAAAEMSPEKQRARTVRLTAMAAGLLLATVGIYGSLRTGTARTERTAVGTGAAGTEAADARADRGSAAKESGDGAGGVSDAGAAGRAPAVTESRRPPDRGTEPAATARGTAPAVAAARSSAVAKPVAVTRPVTVTKPTTAAKPVTVAATEKATASNDDRAKDDRAKDRRDDAAMEAALAERPARGKFLYVPGDVMEKHLLSARKPVEPAGATGPSRVVLNAFIAKDGTVSRTDVVEGPPALINSAMAAVSWRRYRPFLVHGQPAEVVTPVTVSYGAR